MNEWLYKSRWQQIHSHLKTKARSCNGNEWIISSCKNFVVCISQADTVKSVSDNYSDNISANGPIKGEITTHSVRRTDIYVLDLTSEIDDWKKNIYCFPISCTHANEKQVFCAINSQIYSYFFFREMDGYGHFYTIPISLRRRVLYTRFRKKYFFLNYLWQLK